MSTTRTLAGTSANSLARKVGQGRLRDRDNDELARLSQFGNGSRSFAPQVLSPTGRFASDVVVSDFDRDHHLDLAVPDTFNATVTILRGKGDGTFELLAQYAPGLAPVALTAGSLMGTKRWIWRWWIWGRMR